MLVTNAAGVVTQNWYYPSPADCLTCHTPVASYVLGVNTRQLNGANTYPPSGVTDNQLRALNRLGLFYPAFDEGGITNLRATLQRHQPDRLAGRSAPVPIWTPTAPSAISPAAPASPSTRVTTRRWPIRTSSMPRPLFRSVTTTPEIVAPSDVWRSVLYDRMNTADATVKMPPLARNLIDSNAVAVMAEWINSLGGTPALAPPVLTPAPGIFTNQVTLALQPPDGLRGALLHPGWHAADHQFHAVHRPVPSGLQRDGHGQRL